VTVGWCGEGGRGKWVVGTHNNRKKPSKPGKLAVLFVGPELRVKGKFRKKARHMKISKPK